MSRTASMSRPEAESILGPRGQLTCNIDNRAIVRKWLVACGVASSYVGTLAMGRMQDAYNDAMDSALAKIRADAATMSPDSAAPNAGNSVFDEAPHPPFNPHEMRATLPQSPIGTQTPITAPQGDAAGAALAAMVAPFIFGAIRADVLREVDRRLEATPTVRIEIMRRDGTLAQIDGHQHPKFAVLARAASARLSDGYVPNIFLSGEASSGKTTACRHLAKALSLDWHFNGAISMPHEMLGFIDAGGKYHRTPFRDAYERGGVYTFDEVDRSDPVALLAVNPHLANGVATFPDGQIERHPDCIVIGTANTWGMGADANYSGATKLDAAFLSRFPVRISWDIDTALEQAIGGNEKWTKRVVAARRRAQAVGLKVMIDTRITQAGAALIAAGMSFDEAANATYLANLKPEQRQIVEGV